jgi:hypothetical protein
MSSCIRLSERDMFIRARREFAAIKACALVVLKDLYL